MPQQKVAFDLQDISNDLVDKIDGTSYNDVTPVVLCQSNSAFWLEANPDNIVMLCTKIPNNTTISGTFLHGSQMYNVTAQNFVGTRPPVRPR